ncbi:hypothetical protein N431DRAFT_562917 [Stipitochalara longipes BDJ]|nr:hypothetical protein N431DRAFT_562917 [Stipitochalara longipes BDJ]
MIIVQQFTGGPWKCINEFTSAEIEFADVSAIPRLGTAMNSGVDSLFIQLGTGSIFPACDTPAAVQAVWKDFFMANDYISMIGWCAAGEAGMMASELAIGAEMLAETVLEAEGIGEWVLFILGLISMRGQKIKSGDIDISRATPPWKTGSSDIARILGNRKTSKKTLELQKLRTNSVATHSIHWMNSIPTSASSITISSWNINGGAFQHRTISPDPAGTVVHPNGTQSLGWYDGAIGFEPWSNGWIILSLPKAKVGVNIHVPGRFASIGPPPYYQIWYSGIEGNSWTTPVTDPSQRYYFPVDKVGYKITVTPQASAETLFITVNMQIS